MLENIGTALGRSFNILGRVDAKYTSPRARSAARSITPVSEVIPGINYDLNYAYIGGEKRPEIPKANRSWLAFKVSSCAEVSDHTGNTGRAIYNYVIESAKAAPFYKRGQDSYVVSCGFTLDGMVPACVERIGTPPELVKLPDWYRLHKPPRATYLFFNSAVIGVSDDPDMPITAFHVRHKVPMYCNKNYKKPPGQGTNRISDLISLNFDEGTGLSEPILPLKSAGLWQEEKLRILNPARESGSCTQTQATLMQKTRLYEPFFSAWRVQ